MSWPAPPPPLGARFRGTRVEVAPGANLEARARAARRAALPPGSATGHTMDDQAETVLVNLLRGAGLDGLAGMVPGPDHPLLAVRRAETHALCQVQGLEPVEDPSNADRRFVRNRVRHELLPLASAIAGRDLVPVLARQAALLADEARLLDDMAAEIDPGDAEALSAAPAPLARRATRRWSRGAEPHPPDLAAVERVLAVARGTWAPPTWRRGCGCAGGAGHCRRRRSARGRPVVSAPDDRRTRHEDTGATVTADRWLDDPDLGQVVVAEDVLQKRVAELGDELTADYEDRPPLLVGVLKGAFVFMSDLARAIRLPVEVDVMAVASYGSATTTSGVVRIVKDLDSDLTDRHVLVVEDIVDSGLTLSYLRRSLLARAPASLEVCALLVKEGRQRAKLDLRYVGFRIPPDFVVGYGLDVAERYRNVPDIRVYQGPVPVD